MLTVAIVGRPNVGKSSLFNRLAGKRLAIVHDLPGVTRDWREAEVESPDGNYRLIDTAGFEPGKGESLSARMTEQTRAAIAQSDLCLFVLDARTGLTTADETVSSALHRAGKPVIVVANKCEGRTRIDSADALALGHGDAIGVSAEHNLGIAQLLAAFSPHLENGRSTSEVTDESEDIRLALVGRPNVGKSSLFNLLLGQDRALTGPEAGLTRDAVSASWRIGDRPVLLHDTAGLRRKARTAGKTLEQLSVTSALDAIRFAECVVLIVDAQEAFEKQDLTIADQVEREGRAIVFALNKWDLLPQRAGAISRFRLLRDELLPQLAGSPLVAISALTGEGIDRLEQAILQSLDAWNKRIATAELNRFFNAALAGHAPPAVHGRRTRLRYMTQVKARPPTFALFGSQLKSLPAAYLRYLQNGLREKFQLGGAPIRFLLRQTANPYAERAKGKSARN
ncbi:MAG: ribosome biogenesis GTPase Der [Alphaproteobacteria bacterium]|nr:ribosome biogenesis GTPase Der [Alphaproteobacteria bacterium]